MRLPPYIYDRMIRPRFAVKKYIKNIIEDKFNFQHKSVLDFGCGTGSNSFMFDSDGYLGVDIDENAIEYAKRLFSTYSFQTMRNNLIPAQDESFDFVVILATIHHISDEAFELYTKEFSRVLREKGRIVVIEPCLFSSTRFRNWFMKSVDEGKYIRPQEQYLRLFEDTFDITIHKRFKKPFFYNEIFFSARRN